MVGPAAFTAGQGTTESFPGRVTSGIEASIPLHIPVSAVLLVPGPSHI